MNGIAAGEDADTDEETVQPSQPYVAWTKKTRSIPVSELPELHWPWEETESHQVYYQRKTIEEIIDIDAIRNMQCDISGFPRGMERLSHMCDCPHGLRTMGMCAHRAAVMRLLSTYLSADNFYEKHPRARAAGELQMNIEKIPYPPNPSHIAINHFAANEDDSVDDSEDINEEEDDQKDVILESVQNSIGDASCNQSFQSHSSSVSTQSYDSSGGQSFESHSSSVSAQLYDSTEDAHVSNSDIDSHSDSVPMKK